MSPQVPTPDNPPVNADTLDGNAPTHYLNRDNHTGTDPANEVSVADAGGYFTAPDAEGVLQEIGAQLAGGGGASGFVEDGIVTSIFQSTANTNVYTDIFAMELTLTGNGIDRMKLELTAGDLSVIAGVANSTQIRLYNVTDAVAICHALHNNPGASAKSEPVFLRGFVDPFVGVKVFKAQMKRNGAGTTTINGNGDQPRLLTMTAEWAPPT